ncbi:MAG: esterase family protein [Myxococcaceae bacterium]
MDHHHWYSPRLGREMGLTVFGHWGPPLLAFPTSFGNEWEYFDRGVVGALSGPLDAGRVKLYCLDANHRDSFHNEGAHPFHRSWAQRQYDEYVRDEVVPFIHSDCGGALPIATLGASMGGYHAANSLLKHPDVFKRCFALSGLYDMRSFMGGLYDDNFYFNNPVDYVANLSDPWYLEQLAGCDIHLVTGCGPWEDSSTAYQLSGLLRGKGVAHHLDDWGPEGGHDWPYWNRMLREYGNQLG